ncbi:hypothetical protein KVG96_19170 [Pseudomonas sp. COR58]|uniref:Uncharacterized protein n=1 Tax=Pseudomonas ekonensis TaxID=2842353 RepID=A0ABS6PHX6_9PSED|nr:hypothetical protein [Pseudomonas ekonensis]MBV4460081.1 hypothetical protein [Pseudomonas ekonensis]
MDPLNEVAPIIKLTFSLPETFKAPADGENETVVEVHADNGDAPIRIKEWRFPAITDGQWDFAFEHRLAGIGVRYRINVQLFRDRQPLLVKQDHIVIVNRAPHRQTVHLSPVGYLHVNVQEPEAVAPQEAVTISLHEPGSPDVELVRVTQDEQSARSFYLRYDPRQLVPGRQYALSGIENRYHQRIAVYPGLAELVPPASAARSVEWPSIIRRLAAPLRLFTDVTAKFR